MHLRILTPERIVLDEENVDGVTARSTHGEFGVLPRHLPLVAPLDIALLTYKMDGKHYTAAVMGGMFSTDGQKITVLSDAAELSDEIDTTRAKHARERAEARLREKVEDVDTARAELALTRAVARLKAAERESM